jgi:CO/xanthine dehydrogenase Mo-binding subunit
MKESADEALAEAATLKAKALALVRDMAARAAQVDREQVTVHVTQLGGGFGRRLEVDFVGQAVHVAMAWTNSLTALKHHPEIHYSKWLKNVS